MPGYRPDLPMQWPMAPIPPEQSLIRYPSAFPARLQLHAERREVLGEDVDGFVEAIVAVARRFDSSFDASTVELRRSRGGRYLGVTITVTANSRDQLDELYRTLSTHPMVKVVL